VELETLAGRGAGRGTGQVVLGGRPRDYASDEAPYTLHPTPYTIHPTPYTLHPKP